MPRIEIAPEIDSPAELRELGEADIAEVSGGSFIGTLVSIFTSRTKAQSDVAAKYSQYNDGIAQNLK